MILKITAEEAPANGGGQFRQSDIFELFYRNFVATAAGVSAAGVSSGNLTFLNFFTEILSLPGSMRRYDLAQSGLGATR